MTPSDHNEGRAPGPYRTSAKPAPLRGPWWRFFHPLRLVLLLGAVLQTDKATRGRGVWRRMERYFGVRPDDGKDV